MLTKSPREALRLLGDPDNHPKKPYGFSGTPIKKIRTKPYGSFLELMTGVEPVTSSLPRMCATYCATSAYIYCVVGHQGLEPRTDRL